MAKKPIVCAFVSDPHIGSELGICPPQGVTLSQGGKYTPGKIQRWLWRKAWVPYWRWIGDLVKRVDGHLRVVVNGDAMDSHAKGQIVSQVPGHLMYLGVESFRPIVEMQPGAVWFVQGTPSHTGGEAADLEEDLASRLHDAEKLAVQRNGHLWTWPEIDFDWYGTRVHVTHHGKVGGREHTLHSNAAGHAADIANAYRARGYSPDHLWITAHRHTLADSGQSLIDDMRYVVLPSFQAMTPYAHKVVSHRPAFLQDIGGLAGIFYPDERPYQLLKFVVRPTRDGPDEIVK